ncbi:MAG: hypothetical protein ACHQ2Y_06300 [Candidatus Lutacidiplasmatales archaeon]
MSSVPATTDFASLQEKTLNLYIAVMVLMLLGIGLLVVYSLLLGPITGPGVESSYGYALALGFVMAAVMAHVADQTYRVWPLGRKTVLAPPGIVTERGISRALIALVILLAAGAVSYLMWILLNS